MPPSCAPERRALRRRGRWRRQQHSRAAAAHRVRMHIRDETWSRVLTSRSQGHRSVSGGSARKRCLGFWDAQNTARACHCWLKFASWHHALRCVDRAQNPLEGTSSSATLAQRAHPYRAGA